MHWPYHRRSRGLRGSSLFGYMTPEQECVAYLGTLIESCCLGRPDTYWYTTGVEHLRGLGGERRAAMSPVLRRAKWLAQYIWEQHPNHPTYPNNPHQEVPDGLFD